MTEVFPSALMRGWFCLLTILVLVHYKSTGSRPLALFPPLELFYYGYRFSHFFLPLAVQSSYYPSPPTQNIAILVLPDKSCKQVLEE